MLKKRLLTALVGLPAVIALFAYGPQWLLILLFLAFVTLAAYETAILVIPVLSRLGNTNQTDDKSSDTPQGVLNTWHTALAISGSILVFVASSAGQYHGGRGMIIVGILTVMAVGALSTKVVEQSLIRSAGMVFVVCYSTLPWLSVWDLYLMGEGSRNIIFLLGLVWAGDSGAYFAGMAFGKHKLAPVISPKKTWEGAIGGLLCSVAGGFAVHTFYLPTGGIAPWQLVVTASVIGGIVGQLGDLIESVLKRSAGVKDSGQVFPGHGGFLDRVDSLMFAAPVVWFILYSFGPAQ